MRKIVFLLAFTLGVVSPARALKHVNVEELEQLLFRSHGMSDGKVAEELSAVVLTERASSIRLARWQTEFPGRRCHEALTELADASAFLNLPAVDMPADAPPDRDAQKAMLEKTVSNVNTTFKRLPNFYATRKTERFEDTPPRQTVEKSNSSQMGRGSRSGMMNVSQGQSDYIALHSVGRSSVTVSFRDGDELVNSKKVILDPQSSQVTGLTTKGEFGPILNVVLFDAIAGKIAWGHWEQGAYGVEAVLSYTVPQDQSHYMVSIPVGAKVDQVIPAYHGEISIAPDSGSILRITVIADFAPEYRWVYTALLVEYGAVPIGGASYICPIKGVAISRMPTTIFQGERNDESQTQTQLNDVAFTDYHLFRAESRILTGDSAVQEEPQPAHR